jgi:hypothetical protein
MAFQAANINAFRSKRVVCVIRTPEFRFKAFQIAFSKDGSLLVTFPYFRHRTGILSASAIPANETRQSQVNLEQGGKVTSHDVKYSHHPDGRAHFSQDGKIFTAIKRQSIALDRQHGHIFSLIIQGLRALDVADPIKDTGISSKRCVIDFQIEASEAVKFVGWWYDVNKMRFNNPTLSIGPTLMLNSAGLQRAACLVAHPGPNVTHVLAVSCEKIPKLGPEPELFVFYGGFDPPEKMIDATKEAKFLAFIYPISDVKEICERVGSVDYVPK